jgi:hypothetical protein
MVHARDGEGGTGKKVKKLEPLSIKKERGDAS